MTDFETHPAGTAALLAELTAAQKYRYIGKDGKPVLPRDLEDRIEQLEAEVTCANAATAAAYEAAAQMVQSTAYTSNGDGRSLEPVSAGLVGMDMHHATIAAAIRAIATPDQTAALDKLIAEAVEPYVEALIWCSGSPDFNDGGFAREGWLKLCEPLLAASKKGGE